MPVAIAVHIGHAVAIVAMIAILIARHRVADNAADHRTAQTTQHAVSGQAADQAATDCADRSAGIVAMAAAGIGGGGNRAGAGQRQDGQSENFCVHAKVMEMILFGGINLLDDGRRFKFQKSFQIVLPRQSIKNISKFARIPKFHGPTVASKATLLLNTF
jgi:hypothetical protein